MKMTLNDSEAMLCQALQKLQRSWALTASVWRDKARSDFEKEHIQQLETAVHNARHAMRAVNELLSQAARECS